jgi:hypothetical protein
MTRTASTPADEPRTMRGDRTCDCFWPLREVDGDPHQGHGWAGVELSGLPPHRRKQFTASAFPASVFDNGWTQTSVSLLTAPAWRKVAPVARYSATALAAFAEAALAEFRWAYAAGDAGVRALFAPIDA